MCDPDCIDFDAAPLGEMVGRFEFRTLARRSDWSVATVPRRPPEEPSLLISEPADRFSPGPLQLLDVGPEAAGASPQWHPTGRVAKPADGPSLRIAEPLDKLTPPASPRRRRDKAPAAATGAGWKVSGAVRRQDAYKSLRISEPADRLSPVPASMPELVGRSVRPPPGKPAWGWSAKASLPEPAPVPGKQLKAGSRRRVVDSVPRVARTVTTAAATAKADVAALQPGLEPVDSAATSACGATDDAAGIPKGMAAENMSKGPSENAEVRAKPAVHRRDSKPQADWRTYDFRGLAPSATVPTDKQRWNASTMRRKPAKLPSQRPSIDIHPAEATKSSAMARLAKLKRIMDSKGP